MNANCHFTDFSLLLRKQMKTLKSCNVPTDHLGVAEQFLLLLTAVPHYQVRVAAMTMVSEFQPSIQDLEPPMQLLLSVCRRLMSNRSLQDFLAVVLQLGNYLNAVSDQQSASSAIFSDWS